MDTAHKNVIEMEKFKMQKELKDFISEWTRIVAGMKDRHTAYVQQNDMAMADVTLKGISVANAILYDLGTLVKKGV